ncbi:MAG: polyprenol monophosphomannose synthase [Candidatus Peribacteraceae bacterium]
MLSLILPTYNEAGNIKAIVERLQKILAGIPHEIIVVDDDSPDGTWKIVEALSAHDTSIHSLRRVGRRGLSSAVVEGFGMAHGTVLAVADADGQHDYTILPALYQAVVANAGLAIGSRYVEGGSTGNWNESRRLLSRLATWLTLSLCRVHVADPMSGFFAISRQTFESIRSQLRPRGFKILFEILLHVRSDTAVTEAPYTFGVRKTGESKMTFHVELAFLFMLFSAAFHRIFTRSSL